MPEYKSPQSEQGMEQKFLLVFLLMAVVIFGAQLYMKKYAPQQPARTAHPNQPNQPIQTPPAPAQPPSSTAQAAVAPQPKKPNKNTKAEPGSKQAQSEAEPVIDNELYRITFTKRGALAKWWSRKQS